jgi:hypothetical protein
MAAITQIRHRHSDGRAYYEKKLAEGRTHKEALRSLKPVQGFGGLAESGSGAGESGGGGGLLHRGGDGGAVMPEGQELLQAGGGLQGGVQEHAGAGSARVGFERGQAGDHAHRAGGQLQHRVRHPVERGGVTHVTCLYPLVAAALESWPRPERRVGDMSLTQNRCSTRAYSKWT